MTAPHLLDRIPFAHAAARAATRVRLSLITVLLAVAAGLGSLAPNASAETKILRVMPHADLANLDPVFASNLITREFGLMVYEELFAWDAELQPRPQMVSAWSVSPDQLVWRFTLRDGLRFHDGAPVTTADVIASLKRWMPRDLIGAKVAAVVASLDPVGASTFELHLKRPFPAMPFALGSAIGQTPLIMRAQDIAAAGDKPITNANGSGPFRFNHAARVSGALAVYDRNADYVPRREPADGLAGGRVVKVDRVEWHFTPDAATAAAALQSGEMDIWEWPTADLVPLLLKNQQVRVQKLTELATQAILRPNSLYPPFDKPEGRLALAYIVNQTDVMTAGVGDAKFWQRCRSYFICNGPYGTEVGTEDFGPNPAKAQELLAKAGYHGEKLILLAAHDLAPSGDMAEVVADELRKAGVNIEIAWADWGSTSARTANQKPPSEGGWNLFVTNASGPNMHHPMTNANTNMACDRSNNAGWPCDETAERLRQAFIDADDATRPAALTALHRRLAAVEPYLVLGQYDQPIALRANVTGLLSLPIVVYWNIDKP